jgi:predicted methyltransferase
MLIRSFTAALLIVLATPLAASAAVPDYIAKAVADPSRPKADTDRDALRLPAETIAFAGVKPGMTVGELTPGGGYFTRMLSAVVGPSGHIYGIEAKKWDDGTNGKVAGAVADHNVTMQDGQFGDVHLPEQVDLFWITQNYHDLHIVKYDPVAIATFNKNVFHVLKPGGTYFIVDHQANPGTDEAQIAKLHRIEKAQVIREVEAAGFKLEGEGDALHRPGDDHTKSIFDKSIRGHTDQYMLKFVKP